MIHPDLETFRKKCAEGNLIPVWREILADMETPVSAFRKIADSEHAFLLESVEQGENLGRYSFLGCDPEVVFKCKGQEIQILYHNNNEEDFSASGDPLEALREFMTRYKPVADHDLPPFTGGAVGYLGYDMVRHWENIPDSVEDDLRLPDAYLCMTETLIAFDHVKHRMVLISNAHVQGNPDEAYEAAVRKIERLRQRLRLPAHSDVRRNGEDGGVDKVAVDAVIGSEGHPVSADGRIRSNMTKGEFETAVKRAKEYIAAGDIFQVVPSQRFHRDYQGDPFDLYRALRAVNPSPYMYYVQLGDLRLAGSSPEILIRLDEDEVVVRPIAGTRPRGKTREEDCALERDLLADPKECAEHIMLVDLGRNDVGRVCRYGSVQADDLMVIERYSHVMHIVSNVRGRLLKGLDAFDVLRAGFPAGTVSGAPKIRAMEIIDELEPVRRGPYSGAVGYVGFNGHLDTAIAIRTMVICGGRVHIQAGCGVVADSVPEREYQETVDKAGALMRAVDMAEEGLD